MEKAEVLDVFASVFSGKFSTWVTEGEGGDWENEELLTEDDQVQDRLRNVKVHKPTGPDALHPQVLRELVEEAAKPLTIHRRIAAVQWSFHQMEKEKQTSNF